MLKSSVVVIHLYVKVPPGNPPEVTYLCHSDTSPIPWDQEDLFFVTDRQNRNWFCHKIQVPFDNKGLRKLANQMKKDYSPTTKQAALRRLRNPLIAEAVVCKADTQDELRDYLGDVVLKGGAHED